MLHARDYHSKPDRIKYLQQKAADKNEVDIYSRTNRGRTEICGVYALPGGDSDDAWHVGQVPNANVKTGIRLNLKAINATFRNESRLAEYEVPVPSSVR